MDSSKHDKLSWILHDNFYNLSRRGWSTEDRVNDKIILLNQTPNNTYDQFTGLVTIDAGDRHGSRLQVGNTRVDKMHDLIIESGNCVILSSIKSIR